jgi:hypothetical protein
MGDKNTYSNVTIGMSKVPETTQGDMHTLAAEFDGYTTNALNVVSPNIEKISNAGIIGLHREWATQHENDYITHPSLTFSDRVNTNQFAVLLALFLSGTITDTELGTAEAYDQDIAMLDTSVSCLLKSVTLAADLGGTDELWASVVANTLQISHQNGQPAQYQVGVVGSGKFDFMSAQTPALVLPTPVTQNYTRGGYGVSFKLTNGSLVDYSGLHRLKAFNFQASNNVVLNDRRAGDALRTAADIESGFYQSQMECGPVRTASLTADVFADGTKTEKTAHLNNTEITDIRLKMTGGIIASTFSNEVEIIIPQAIIRTHQTRDDQGKLIHQLEFDFQNSGSNNLWTARVRQLAATLFG